MGTRTNHVIKTTIQNTKQPLFLPRKKALRMVCVSSDTVNEKLIYKFCQNFEKNADANIKLYQKDWYKW